LLARQQHARQQAALKYQQLQHELHDTWQWTATMEEQLSSYTRTRPLKSWFFTRLVRFFKNPKRSLLGFLISSLRAEPKNCRSRLLARTRQTFRIGSKKKKRKAQS
jgi:hypothetical protein